MNYCGTCVSYLTDEKDEKLTDFYHDRNCESGFCAMRDLFYTVKKQSRACTDYTNDGEDNE